MPSIDCGLNPTAVNDEKNSAGIAALLFFVISLLLFLRSFWKSSKSEE